MLADYDAIHTCSPATWSARYLTYVEVKVGGELKQIPAYVYIEDSQGFIKQFASRQEALDAAKETYDRYIEKD